MPIQMALRGTEEGFECIGVSQFIVNDRQEYAYEVLNILTQFGLRMLPYGIRPVQGFTKFSAEKVNEADVKIDCHQTRNGKLPFETSQPLPELFDKAPASLQKSLLQAEDELNMRDVLKYFDGLIGRGRFNRPDFPEYHLHKIDPLGPKTHVEVVYQVCPVALLVHPDVVRRSFPQCHQTLISFHGVIDAAVNYGCFGGDAEKVEASADTEDMVLFPQEGVLQYGLHFGLVGIRAYSAALFT